MFRRPSRAKIDVPGAGETDPYLRDLKELIHRLPTAGTRDRLKLLPEISAVIFLGGDNLAVYASSTSSPLVAILSAALRDPRETTEYREKCLQTLGTLCRGSRAAQDALRREGVLEVLCSDLCIGQPGSSGSSQAAQQPNGGAIEAQNPAHAGKNSGHNGHGGQHQHQQHQHQSHHHMQGGHHHNGSHGDGDDPGHPVTNSLRRWGCWALFFATHGNVANQTTVAGVPGLAQRLRAAASGSWKMWSHNDAEEMLKMLDMPLPGGGK